jgi:hypothetical protein
MNPPPKDAVVRTDPDPTLAVEKAVTLAIDNLRREFNQRFDANDTAVALARDEVKISAAELANANSEALKFALKTATDASLQLADSFKIDSKATNEKIDRLTERINIWTGRDSSVVENRTERSSDKGQTLIIITIIVAVAALALALVPHFK